jgi:hypothetical protein
MFRLVLNRIEFLRSQLALSMCGSRIRTRTDVDASANYASLFNAFVRLK